MNNILQLFEPNECVLKFVWWKFTRQIEQLLHVVANLSEILFGYNPSCCVLDQSRMTRSGLDIINQQIIQFPRSCGRLILKKIKLMV